MEKTNVEKLKEILGENGRYYVTLGPEGHKLSEEQIAGSVLTSIEEVLSGKAEEITEMDD